eukprot:Nk52_evm6s2256 gene=Nk52_evmTU6s2256
MTCAETVEKYLQYKNLLFKYRYVIPLVSAVLLVVPVLAIPAKVALALVAYVAIFFVVRKYSSIDEEEQSKYTDRCTLYTERKGVSPEEFMDVIDNDWSEIQEAFDEEDRLEAERLAKLEKERQKALEDAKKTSTKKDPQQKPATTITEDCTSFISSLRKKLSELTTDLTSCGMRKRDLLKQKETNSCDGVRATVESEMKTKYDSEVKDCKKIEYNASLQKSSKDQVLADEAARRQKARTDRIKSRADAQLARNEAASAVMEEKKSKLDAEILKYQQEIDALKAKWDREKAALNAERQRLIAEQQNLDKQKRLASAAAKAEIERKERETRAKLAQLELKQIQAENESKARLVLIAQKEQEQAKLINQKTMESELVKDIITDKMIMNNNQAQTECPRNCHAKGKKWYQGRWTSIKSKGEKDSKGYTIPAAGEPDYTKFYHHYSVCACY